jgi:hypothetical protein
LNGIILHLKSGTRLRQRQPIKGWIVQVNNGLAVKAHEMMMAVGLDLVSGSSPRMTHFPCESNPNQRLQSPVDSRAGHLPHFSSDVFKDLVGGGVISTARQGLQNQAPLNRKRKRVLPASLFEFLRRRTTTVSNAHEDRDFIASGIGCQR